MNNKEIARQFNLLGKLMELHGENKFKIRSYYAAYNNLRKYPEPLIEMSEDQLADIPGIGKAIQGKILALKETGTMPTLERFLEVTPTGIVEMLMIKGLGPKKVDQLWKELQIESPGELLYACNENRLVELKGFGEKTQSSIKEQIEYHLASSGKFHFGSVEQVAMDLLNELQESFEEDLVELTGEIARRLDIINQIEIIGTMPESSLDHLLNQEGVMEYMGIPVEYIESDPADFWMNLIETSSAPEYLDVFEIFAEEAESEEDVYDQMDLNYHPAFIRQKENISWLSKIDFDDTLIIQDDDIKGVVHNHSTYSDGVNTLAQMAEETEKLGYEYLVMTDHSKSAFYANGLQVERLMDQLEEIEELNKKVGIKVFSGIESDILINGDLDYEEDMLKRLDVIVASVHSVLKMDIDKATNRLIKAVENPYTKILGHPTGRLLLSRKGYPVDFTKVIDACAANGVAIEVNANPYRLDIDWRYIQEAMDKGVLISINPDAHSIAGIKDIHFGVMSASKGGLTSEMCLNAKSLEDFERWIAEKF